MTNTMTEPSFARSFLAALDTKPVRYQTDYAVDPKTYEPAYPYVLPRMPHAMRKGNSKVEDGTENASGSAKGLTINLKSSKNPQLDLQLLSQPSTMGILELKQLVAEKVGLDTTEKVRLLYKKRPCADSKTIKEVLGAESDSPPNVVEFSVMIMGGMLEKKESASDVAMTDAPVAVGPSGATVLEDQEFWSDLEGFLQQRLKDTNVANQATALFKTAWINQSKNHEENL